MEANAFWELADNYLARAGTPSKRQYFTPYGVLRMNGTTLWPKDDGGYSAVMVAVLVGHNAHKYYAFAASAAVEVTDHGPWVSKFPHNVVYNPFTGIFRVKKVFVQLDRPMVAPDQTVELQVDSADQASCLGMYPLMSEITFAPDAVFLDELEQRPKSAPVA